MDKLNINELLRYGFSGAVLFFGSLLSFKQAVLLIKVLPSNFFGISVVFGIVLVIGSIIYGIHRAILYTVLYKICCIFVYGKKQADTVNLDVQRWERYNNPKSLQNNLREWASQIHFLYCSTWAIVLAQLIGHCNKWNKTNLYQPIWFVGIVLGVSALIHHLRYLKYEYRLFNDMK